MSRRLERLGAIAIFTAILWVQPAAAQMEQEMSPEEKAMMEAWMKAGTPNENHQRLAQFEGTWDVISLWWPAPGAPSQESRGTANYKMVLGGRYLEETVTSQMMDRPFEGRGYTAYDNLKKSYLSAWMDNMGTGIMVSEGQWDAGANTYTWASEYTDPVSGKLKKMRMVTKVVAPDKHVAEFFEQDAGGKEYKSMEITYTRK